MNRQIPDLFLGRRHFACNGERYLTSVLMSCTKQSSIITPIISCLSACSNLLNHTWWFDIHLYKYFTQPLFQLCSRLYHFLALGQTLDRHHLSHMGLRKSRAIKHPSPFGLFAWRMHIRSRGLANKYVTCDIYCSSKSGTFPPQETFSILPERVLTFVCWIIMLCILYASPEVMSLCYWHVLIPAP